MPFRVKVRAVIWVGERLVVHRSQRLGEERISLPGGRVNSRESVTDALVREAREELGLDIEVGDLLFAAEIIDTYSRQDVELIFDARFLGDVDGDALSLIDPLSADAEKVFPPVLDDLARCRADNQLRNENKTWLGNLYEAVPSTFWAR
jgi:ADP-ribose pyrophosphatase YjhB (NUDIX family)